MNTMRISENTYLAQIPSIQTLNLPNQLKPQLLINPQIRKPLRTLQITRNSLPVRHLSNNINQHPSNTHPPHPRIDRNHITEVIPARIRPDRLMRFLLYLFPEIIPTEIQSPTAEVADIVEELAEGKKPVLCPGGPGSGLGGRLWTVPPADAYDLGTGIPVGFGLLVWVWGVLGHIDWGVAVDAVLQMGG